MRLSGHCNIAPSGPPLTWFTNPVGTWLVPGTGGHGQQEDPEPHPRGDYHPLIKPCPFSMAPPNATSSRKPSRITQLFRELLPLTLFLCQGSGCCPFGLRIALRDLVLPPRDQRTDGSQSVARVKPLLSIIKEEQGPLGPSKTWPGPLPLADSAGTVPAPRRGTPA